MLSKIIHKSSSILKRQLHTELQNAKSVPWIKPNGFETPIVVYNPMAKCRTPLILRNQNIVSWYLCGPTVYDSAHIGHACTYVRFDIIQRIMSEFFHLNVVQVMGLTDIDDKIIKRSTQSNQDWKQLTKFYENEFFEDMKSLNVTKPYISCRVTDHVTNILEFVEKLLKKDFAYVANDGSVYFDTLKYDDYGKLAKPELDSDHPDKKSSLDFALWKSSKPGEPSWESPWGPGRPGWHIECSAIASSIFGNNMDIHGGGIDLAFPHHENEEAQSCCYHNSEQWVNYWLHTGHLHLPGDQKMSKSLKNTISIRELLQQFTPNEFRMFCLSSSYKTNTEFSPLIMQHAALKMKKIQHFLHDCDNYVAGVITQGSVNEPDLLFALHETEKQVLSALKDDFNTSKAVNEIFKLISITNKMLQETKGLTEARNPSAIAAVSKYVSTVISKLGISNSMKNEKEGTFDMKSVLDDFLEFRSSVRNKALTNQKDLELLEACDLMRRKLSIHGVDIKDQKNGPSTWTIVKN